ncbi:MAG: serine/threonine-protein kinase [Gemmataceae bacterium]
MGVKDKAIAFCKRFGKLSGLGAAKSAAKMALSALLPGGSVVVDLVEVVLDCVHETAKDQLIFVDRPLAASAEDLRRVEEMLGTLTDDLAPFMERVVRLEKRQDEVDRVFAEAMETLDERGRNALDHIDHLARRFDILEAQNKKLLQGQGYASGMLAEMLPLMRRMASVADFIEDLCKAGVSPSDFRSCLHEFQDAARAFRDGRIAEAGMRFQKAAQSQPQSAAAATALAGAKAAEQDFVAAEQSIARAARLRPDDAELAELHRRVTVASRGATPREPVASPGASRQPPKAGDTLDGWRLDLLLGHGGWGRVFKASRSSEVRALKVMHPDLSRDPQFVERFKKEILTLAGLRGHKNLVAIDSFGYAIEAGCWYFVMELIEGTSLERYLHKRGALTLAQARLVFLALADGLAVAHARGIIHRDLKPANILLRRPNGAPVLVDFGLAAVADDKGLTQTGRSAGYTAMFAAPEQLRGKAADVRSDIYSLAASLYYALIYEKPEHREADQFEPEMVPEVLRDLLASALHLKPERRPETIQAFCEKLRAPRGSSSSGPSSKEASSETPIQRSSDAAPVKRPEENYLPLYLPKLDQTSDAAPVKRPEEPIHQQPTPPVEMRKIPRRITMTGKWVDANEVWDVLGYVEIEGRTVRGRMRYTLRQCSPTAPASWKCRVGESAVESVEGTLDRECLTLHGYQVDDPTLLLASETTIVFDRDWRMFEGKTISRSGKSIIRGNLQGSASIEL